MPLFCSLLNSMLTYYLNGCNNYVFTFAPYLDYDTSYILGLVLQVIILRMLSGTHL
jgi:hypothetical protein